MFENIIFKLKEIIQNWSFDVHKTDKIDDSLPKVEKKEEEKPLESIDKEEKEVKFTLNTKNLLMTFKDGTTFNAQLSENGKPVEGEKLVFNICNKDYNRKTDEKGTAKLTINLNPNQYVITTTSKGITNTNTIIVKERPNTKHNLKGIFVRASDTGKLSFTELQQKKYNHIFLSHIIFDTNGEEYVKKFAKKCKIIGAKLIIFYTTYYNGDNMVNPISSEANKRIEKIIEIGKKDYIDGVCLDYNRHNSNNHNDNIMNRITSNTNKVVNALDGKEVYATCMAEHPNAVKNYYHQDILNWKAIPLPMLYKYNYNYNDTKMKSVYTELKKANSNLIPIFQNYHGDDNVTGLSQAELNHDIRNVDSENYLIFRYGICAI